MAARDAALARAEAADARADAHCAGLLARVAARYPRTAPVARALSDAPEAAPAPEMAPADYAAADAAAAVVARVLSLDAPAGSGLRTRADAVPQATVTAVATALFALGGHAPIAHKLWEALRLVAGAGPANVALLCQGLHVADHCSGAQIFADWRADVAAVATSPGAVAMADSAEARLRRDALSAGLEVLAEVTAPRGGGGGDAARAHGDDASGDAAAVRHVAEGGADAADRAAPQTATVAALGAGAMSRFVVASLRRRPHSDAVATRLAGVLSNLAATDAGAAGENAVAALLAALPTAPAGGQPRYAAAAVQRQLLAALWNALNHPAGAAACKTLGAADAVRAAQAALQAQAAAEGATDGERAAAEAAAGLGAELLAKLDALVERPRYAAERRPDG